jgi:hypothetical protein
MTAGLALFAIFAKQRPNAFVPLRVQGKLGKSLGVYIVDEPRGLCYLQIQEVSYVRFLEALFPQ